MSIVDQCLMAVETTVSFHENPFDKVVIWERRFSSDISKHRERASTVKPVEKGDLIVIRNSDQESKVDEFNQDYCVIAAATKATGSPRPSILSSKNTTLKLSSRSYETFSKRHLGGDLISPPQTITTQPLPYSYNNKDRGDCSVRSAYSAALKTKGKQFVNGEDVKLFCCGRDVEQAVEYCTCLCCVKGMFYHYTKDSYTEGRIAERPCSCGPLSTSCVKRWTCLTVCSVFLPCLLCYIPAKGCLDVGKCYKQHRYSSVQHTTFKQPH